MMYRGFVAAAPLKRHHALLSETAGVMVLHRNDS